jgi:type VI secretion system protein ImpC
MPSPTSSTSGGRMEFSFTTSGALPAQRIGPQSPFRMLVLADLSGRASRKVCQSLSGRNAVPVDVDRLDGVISRLGVAVELPVSEGQSLRIPIRRFDDLHPDRLVANVPLLQALRTLRMALNNPATFEAAAAQLQALVGPVEQPAATPSPAAQPTEPSGSDFDRLLGQPASAAPSPAKANIEQLIANLVRPHVVSAPDPRQTQFTALVDQAVFVQLGLILHHPLFQRVEAAWRGVQWLISRLDLDQNLQLHIMDVSRDELIADLSRENLAESELYRTLVERTVHTPGANRWAAIALDDYFGPAQDDAALLARLGTVAQQAGAGLISAASAEVLGCPGLDKASDPDKWNRSVDRSFWNQLRALPAAKSIALTFPRLLARLPYGKGQEPTEIGYVETDGRPPHEQYLWANPAFACLEGLARAFLENGWDMEPGGFEAIEDLPMHAFTEDGEKQVQAVAEAYLTDRAAARINEAGINPILSMKNTNTARFAGFSSIATPPAALQGPWA